MRIARNVRRCKNATLPGEQRIKPVHLCPGDLSFGLAGAKISTFNFIVRERMDITKTIAQLKQEPGFTENVGMMLVHNGVVRGWSRGDGKSVSSITVKVDHARVEALRQEYEQKPGIFRVIIEACEGTLKPGDDLLFMVVAGALREDVKPVLAELLDRVKDEAVTKSEAKLG